jgi:hypothetical protein
VIGHYQILGISPGATEEEVMASLERIRAKMGSYAPGVQISDEMIRINRPAEWTAFITLSDPEARAAYDALIKPPETLAEHLEDVKPAGFVNTFLSYAAAIGLMGAIVLFLAFLGSYLI